MMIMIILKIPKAFIEYSNNIQADYKNIEDYKYWRSKAGNVMHW